MSKGLGRDNYNILQNNGSMAGQVVMHVHYHIIPRKEGDAFKFDWPAGNLVGAETLLAKITPELAGDGGDDGEADAE